MKILHLKEIKRQLTTEQKQRLLKSLKCIREQLNSNIGGETDIPADGNLTVSENEFTSNEKPERHVISKKFDTTADFDSYVRLRRGIKITPREKQSIVSEILKELATTPATPAIPTTPSNKPTPSPNKQQTPQKQNSQTQSKSTPESKPNNEDDDISVYDDIRVTKSITFSDENAGANALADFLEELELMNQQPTENTDFYLKYEISDAFGINNTTVIKKLKEGNQFCWTAFSTFKSAEDTNKPSDDKSQDNDEL